MYHTHHNALDVIAGITSLKYPDPARRIPSPGIHIPTRLITEKADWDVFAEKLRNCPDPDPDTNPSFEHRLQLLLRDINIAAMAAFPVSKTKITQSPRSFLPPSLQKPENGLNNPSCSPNVSRPLQLKGTEKNIDFTNKKSKGSSSS